MPFNTTTGVYTPPTGATTAVAGDIIRSATWNSIFVDISTSLSALGQNLYSTTSVTTTPYIPLSTDSQLEVNIAGAAVVNLPTVASRNGLPLYIKDVSGAANTNNITINRNGADTIEGLTSVTIKDAYGGYLLFPVGTTWLILSRASQVQAGGILGNSGGSAAPWFGTSVSAVQAQALQPTFFGTTNTFSGAGPGTITAAQSHVIFNVTGTFTIVLPTASANTSRVLFAKNIAAGTVVSSASNVVPIGTTVAGTALLAGTGKFSQLISDGTNWIAFASN